MSKGSGGTRSKGPNSWREAINAPASARLAFVLANIDARNNDLQPNTNAVMAFDALSDTDRDELLRRLNFTGMVDEDSFYGNGGSLSTVQKIEQSHMWGIVDDFTYYNEPDDDQSFYIGYKDGTVVDTRDWGEAHKFRRSGATWIAGTGLSSGYCWYTEKGKSAMQEYMGYREWKNGKKVN